MSAAPTRLIQLAPEIHERYQSYFRSVFDEGPLDERSRAVVAVAAALTIGNQGAVQTFATAAKLAGLTNEEWFDRQWSEWAQGFTSLWTLPSRLAARRQPSTEATDTGWPAP